MGQVKSKTFNIEKQHSLLMFKHNINNKMSSAKLFMSSKLPKNRRLFSVYPNDNCVFERDKSSAWIILHEQNMTQTRKKMTRYVIVHS
jgi:hypothetical protein